MVVGGAFAEGTGGGGAGGSTGSGAAWATATAGSDFGPAAVFSGRGPWVLVREVPFTGRAVSIVVGATRAAGAGIGGGVTTTGLSFLFPSFFRKPNIRQSLRFEKSCTKFTYLFNVSA